MSIVSSIKISHKILILMIAGLVAGVMYSAGTIIIARGQVLTLENIYKAKVVPLDNLRRIQLVLRELEFRMAGVKADIVAPIGSGEHLKSSMATIEKVWSETEGLIKEESLQEQKTKFEKGLGELKTLSAELLVIYSNEDVKKVPKIIEQYLDIKGLLFKPLDAMAEAQEKAVNSYYLEKKKSSDRLIVTILILTVVGLAGFSVFAIIIIRSINKPIEIVSKAAAKVASGDLSSMIVLSGRDEMGVMAEGLNQMLNKLRETFGSIRSDIETIALHSNGLSESSRSLLQGASQQSQQIEQVSTAATEMSQTILDVAKNAGDAAENTKESQGLARTGAEVVQHAVSSIMKLAENVEHASSAIATLDKSTEQISSILTVIKEIADQTNLLALNAAIEAARAGEQGRGFAVVADEVRKLAEKTAKATGQIAEQIKSVQEETQNFVKVMHSGKAITEEAVSSARQAESALQKIVTSNDHVTDTVTRIATATEEQSAAAEEVSQSMVQISDVVKDTARLSEDVQKAAEELLTISQRSKQLIGQFKTEATRLAVETSAGHVVAGKPLKLARV